MNTSAANDEPTWGVKVNLNPYPQGKLGDGPRWAQSHGMKWNEPGVLVWDRERPQIVYLAPERALDLLTELRETPTWQEQGTTVGDTLYTFPDANPTLALDGDVLVPPVPGDPQARLGKHASHFGTPYTVNPMPLTPGQAHKLYDLLERHEAELQELAEADVKQMSRSVNEVHLSVREEARKREVQTLDLTARPFPWVANPSVPSLVCELPPYRGSVYLVRNSLFWRGSIERPGRFKHESRLLVKAEEALTWVEEELRKAAEEDASAPEVPAKPPRLTPATLSPKLRARLAPYWIAPKVLEPPVVTYRVAIQLKHIPTSKEEAELSFGEKLTISAKYPSTTQLKQRFDLSGTDVDDLGGSGLYSITSTTTYTKEAIATEQAQRLWEQSRIATAQALYGVEWAYFGVAEVETGFVDVLGGVGDWPVGSGDRTAYLAEQALRLTVIHALDVGSYRAMTGRVFAPYNDEQVLRMLHEHRLPLPVIPPQAREESRRWLAERK